jgi:uncharacterized membrane protein
VKFSGIALLALSLLVLALYAYGLFFSPYSEVFLKVVVFAIITVLFGVIGYSPQTEGLKRTRKGARGDRKREER